MTHPAACCTAAGMRHGSARYCLGTCASSGTYLQDRGGQGVRQGAWLTRVWAATEQSVHGTVTQDLLHIASIQHSAVGKPHTYLRMNTPSGSWSCTCLVGEYTLQGCRGGNQTNQQLWMACSPAAAWDSMEVHAGRRPHLKVLMPVVPACIWACG